MKKQKAPQAVVSGTGRSGSSLVEILMSLMVMSIGLVSVAAMFPISMLRSMQATQLTNAGLLYYQCEDYTRAFPNLAYNDFNVAYPTASDLAANTEFVGEPTVPTPSRSPTAQRFGISNATEFVQNLPMKFVSVVDPLGYFYAIGGTPSRFGKDFNGLHGVSDFFYQATRTNAGFDFSNTLQTERAFELFASNDSWSTAFHSIEASIVSTGPTVLQFNDITPEDMLTFEQAGAAGVLIRVIVFDENGKQSHVAGVSAVNPTIQQVELSAPLPANGMYDFVSQVRLETFEPQYSCLITVRRQLMNIGPAGTPGADGVDDDGNGTPDDFYEVGWPGTDDEVRNLGADLVVFFRRDFSELAEQTYEAGNLRQGLNLPVGTQQVTIRWSSANADSKPRIKNGGFVFDPVNGYWYRITAVLDESRPAQNPVNTINDREAVVLLDRAPDATGLYLMVPERVVEVFDFAAF